LNLSKRTEQTVFHTALPTAVNFQGCTANKFQEALGVHGTSLFWHFAKKKKSMTNSELIN
jgi:hypothetical protein